MKDEKLHTATAAALYQTEQQALLFSCWGLMRGDGLLLHIFSNVIFSKNIVGIVLSRGGWRDQTKGKKGGGDELPERCTSKRRVFYAKNASCKTLENADHGNKTSEGFECAKELCVSDRCGKLESRVTSKLQSNK